MIKKAALILTLTGLMVLQAGCGQETAEALAAEPEEIKEEVSEENRLEKILRTGELRIGISADYAPFSFLEKDEKGKETYVGSDLELGNYIAESLGVEAVFCNMEFDQCLDAVRDGQVDMVLLGMLAKPERRSKMAFTDAYYEPGRQILVMRKDEQEDEAAPADRTKVEKAEEAEESEETKEEYPLADEFAGMTVAARYGTLQAQLVVEQLPESYLELTDTIREGIALVRTGLADAVALDQTEAEEILEKYTDIKIYETEFPYTPQEVVGGVVRGEPELLDAVNQAIDEVVSERLYLEWLNEAYSLAADQSRAYVESIEPSQTVVR